MSPESVLKESIDNVDKDRVNMPVPEFPQRVIIGIQDGYCNLKCPMCFIHGSEDKRAINGLKGLMSYEDACKILDEIKVAKPLVNPNAWSEPFIIKDFKKYVSAIRDREIPLIINSNGLLLTDDLAQFLVEIKVSSVFISIDATTEETLEKVRGTTELSKIKEAVFRMLRARGESFSPRVGTSFVVDKANTNEREDFISYWLQHVDVVRVIEEFDKDRLVRKDIAMPEKRIPCGSLYDTMVINHKGDVPICCVDSFNAMIMGNVFATSVKEVWHSGRFQEIRYYHETAQYDKVPFCKNCSVWSNYSIKEEVKDGILIRRSPLMTYYNRMDRMDNWKAGNKANVKQS